MKERKLEVAAYLFSALALVASCAKPVLPTETDPQVNSRNIPTTTLEPSPTPLPQRVKLGGEYSTDPFYPDICTASTKEVPGATGQLQWPTYGPIYAYFTPPHPGIDFGSRYGTPVYAADSGIVFKEQSLMWGYGKYIVIDHGRGRFTLYAHLSEFLITQGQAVDKQQIIGRVGSTGRSTGPHLHFAIIENTQSGCEYVDPLSLLP